MKLIIFAGGIGTRLWPLSRKNSPKQFHKIFGDETSMENSYNTIKKAFNPEDIFVSTGIDYVEHTKEVIPEIPEENIIVEPMVRDTAAAIAYAMLRISEKFPDEPVVIRWQNSLIKDPEAFIGALNEADQVFQNKEADFVYLTVPSRYPNTAVGWIKMDEKVRDLDNALGLYDFGGFTEKPDADTAQEYHDSGQYGWNPGCYITTPQFVLNSFKAKAPEFYEPMMRIKEAFGKENEWDVITEEFEKIEKISIDYALWEKLDHDGIKVVLADYGWFYVSTWKDLKIALQKETLDNITQGEVLTRDSNNNIIYNSDPDSFVTTFGVNDLAIINTPDGLLVCSMEKAEKIKELLAQIKDEGHEDYL